MQNEKMEFSALAKAIEDLDRRALSPEPLKLYLTRSEWKLFEENGWYLGNAVLISGTVILERR